MKVTIQVADEDGNVFAGEAVLARVSGSDKVKIKVQSKSDQGPSTKVTCTSVIERLWKNEKFKEALSLPDVKVALGEEGYSFPRNTTIMALQRAAFLTKHGNQGTYTWRQKYPFNH